jgi:hypothetical protein
MKLSSYLSPKSSWDAGRYHGSGEETARLLAVLTAFVIFLAIALPWMAAESRARRHYESLHDASKQLGLLPPLGMAMTDVLIFLGVFSAVLLYRKLGRRIALGGPEASFLDGVRSAFVSVLMTAALVILETSLFR